MRFKFALHAALLLGSLPVAAQQASTRTAPTDSAAAVPPVRYESAFTGYTPFRDQEVTRWRELNDEAAHIGGHIGIMRGAGPGAGKPASGKPPQAPQPQRSAPKAPAGGPLH